MDKNKKEKVRSFVMSDESVNCYGFRLLTSGGDLEQFRKNPVMLYGHDSDRLPIGHWENIREEEGRLIADAVFDEGDALALEVQRKVDEGIVKCCSIGFDVIEVDESDVLKLPGQRCGTVTRWQLLECSICAIGANYNAMTLSAGARVTLSAGGVHRTEGNLTNPLNKSDMTEQEQNALREECDRLRAANEELTATVAALRGELQQQRARDHERVLSAAVKDGRLTEADRPAWLAMLKADETNALAALNALPTRGSLSQALKQGGAGTGQYAGKSWTELDRAGMLAGYKAADPEGFKALYRETFGVEYRAD